jgi:hypothetical protein
MSKGSLQRLRILRLLQFLLIQIIFCIVFIQLPQQNKIKVNYYFYNPKYFKNLRNL